MIHLWTFSAENITKIRDTIPWMNVRAPLHQVSVNAAVTLVTWISLKRIKSHHNGLQPHSEATLFVSIDFNESYIASVDSDAWCKRALTQAELRLPQILSGERINLFVLEWFLRLSSREHKLCKFCMTCPGPTLIQVYQPRKIHCGLHSWLCLVLTSKQHKKWLSFQPLVINLKKLAKTYEEVLYMYNIYGLFEGALIQGTKE